MVFSVECPSGPNNFFVLLIFHVKTPWRTSLLIVFLFLSFFVVSYIFFLPIALIDFENNMPDFLVFCSVLFKEKIL